MPVTKNCRGCGQGFDIENSPVGNALAPVVCASGHTGPFDLVVQQGLAIGDFEEMVTKVLRTAKVIGNLPGNLTDTELAQHIESTVSWRPIVINAPGQAAILTAAELLQIVNLANMNEHALIALLTPKLVEITEAVGSCFVNSEESAWIPQLERITEAATDRQPDGFSCSVPLFTRRTLSCHELRTLRTNALLAGQVYNNVFRCGKPHWQIKDFYVIWEFKWLITDADRGIVYSYLISLSRGDSDSAYYAFLCDSVGVNIISCTKGVIGAMSQTFAWTAPGSVAAVQSIVKIVGFKQSILNRVAALLNVTVNSFLGAGAFGRCFGVTVPVSGGNVTRALKVILYRHSGMSFAHADTLANNEFLKMVQLSTAPGGLPVMSVVPTSRRTVVHPTTGVAEGSGYLMMHVGVSALPAKGHIVTLTLLRQLFHALAAIHIAGHYHGDARIHNAVFIGNQLTWIDCLDTGNFGAVVNANLPKITHDVNTLLTSTVEHFQDRSKNDAVLTPLLTAYYNAPSVPAANAIVLHIQVNFVRKTM